MDIDEDKTINEALEEEIDPSAGMTAYRKFLWALWYVEKRIEKYKEYLNEVVNPIKQKIESLEENREFLRNRIQGTLANDPNADKTKTGGKTVNLPDVGYATVSEKEKYEYTDEEALMDQLGEDYYKIERKLDKTALKKFIKKECTVDGLKVVVKKTGEVLQGIEVTPEESFRISFTKK